jgi:hypothetical protein
MRVSELRRHRASMLALQLQQQAELKAKAQEEEQDRMRQQRPIAYWLKVFYQIAGGILVLLWVAGKILEWLTE